MSFGDVLISFEIEIYISEDDDSRQTIHHRSVIDNFYVMLVKRIMLLNVYAECRVTLITETDPQQTSGTISAT